MNEVLNSEEFDTYTEKKTATVNREQAVALLLIEHGADPNRKSGYSTTPCETAGISAEFKSAMGCEGQ